jgi:hypothetical protein
MLRNEEERFAMSQSYALIAPIALCLLLSGCGGGETAFVGVGNSGNYVVTSELDEVAKLLSEHESTPQVGDAVLVEIFQAILAKARDGDPSSARIIFDVARRQRDAD